MSRKERQRYEVALEFPCEFDQDQDHPRYLAEMDPLVSLLTVQKSEESGGAFGLDRHLWHSAIAVKMNKEKAHLDPGGPGYYPLVAMPTEHLDGLMKIAGRLLKPVGEGVIYNYMDKYFIHCRKELTKRERSSVGDGPEGGPESWAD